MKRSALQRKTPLAAARSSIQRKQRVSAKKADEKQRAIGRAKRAIKPKRKTLVAKLDKLCSQYIKLRDGRCKQCADGRYIEHRSEEGRRLTWGHLFSRRAFSTRWDPANSFGQCWSHNAAHLYEPYPFYRWFADTFGQDSLDALHRRYVTPTKVHDADLMGMIEKFTRMIADLTAIQADLDEGIQDSRIENEPPAGGMEEKKAA